MTVLFENQREANQLSAIELVERALTELGHGSVAARAGIPGALAGWRVARGSAVVEVSLIERAGASAHLRVAANVMSLDAKVDRAALFERLLDHNASALIGCAFALAGDRVVLIGQRSIRDLDLSEVKSLIGDVVVAADDYDDRLIAEFDGLRA
jgi:hypothetical protein